MYRLRRARKQRSVCKWVERSASWWLWSHVSLVLLILGARVVYAQGGYPQREERFVNDYAGIVSPADEARIRAILSELESDTGIEAIIVTVDTISEYPTRDATFETFVTHLFNAWGIGDEERNDGILIAVSQQERTVRIELGAGYGKTRNKDVQRIVDEYMLDDFRRGAFSRGIYQGVRALAGTFVGTWATPVPTPRLRSNVASTPAGRTSSRETMPGASLALWALGLGGGAVGIAVGVHKIIRYHPRRCPVCHSRMDRLEDDEDDPYLEKGQKAEKSLRSVEHDVWKCPNCETFRVCSYRRILARAKRCTQCGYRTFRRLDQSVQAEERRRCMGRVQRFEESLGAVSYEVWKCHHCGRHLARPGKYSASFRRCPHCRHYTLQVASVVLEAATYSGPGRKRIKRDCQYCDYHVEKTEKIPKKHQPQYYDNYYGSSNYSSSSSSDSSQGGHSSGEGASGRW